MAFVALTHGTMALNIICGHQQSTELFKMSVDFGFITCAELPDLDPDDRLLFNALENKGYKCQPLIWDNPNVDWKAVTIGLLRSTWDYHLKTDAFVRWTESVSSQTVLINSPDLLRWNLNKRYLEQIRYRGLSVVPTAYLKRQQSADILSLMQTNNWPDVVVKPVIGLSTYGVKRINTKQISIAQGQKHVENLLQNVDVMVQPYFSSVESYGERDLIFIGGEYSHCVQKTAFQILAIAGEAGEKLVKADKAELTLAEKIIQSISPSPFYARVDLIRDVTHKPCLLELELIEPNLFFAFHPPAVGKFVAGIIPLLEKQTKCLLE